MKFAFMQNPLTQIPFFAWIYNSFIISHLLEWLKVRQIKSGIRVNFDQCAQPIQPNLGGNGLDWLCYLAGISQTAPPIFSNFQYRFLSLFY